MPVITEPSIRAEQTDAVGRSEVEAQVNQLAEAKNARLNLRLSGRPKEALVSLCRLLGLGPYDATRQALITAEFIEKQEHNGAEFYVKRPQDRDPVRVIFQSSSAK